MPMGRPIPPLTLSPAQHDQLASMARSRSLPDGLVTQAKIILLAGVGLNNIEIAGKLNLSRPTVGQWRRRYLDQGIQGLYDNLRPGGPRSTLPPARCSSSASGVIAIRNSSSS